MTVSFIHLLFPLNTYMEYFFINKTKRKASDIGVTFYNELCLFAVVIEWIRNYTRFFGKYNADIPFAEPEMTKNQLYICNLIWCMIENIYPFAFLMAMIASNTWVKLLFKIRVMKTFGPLFKVINQMILSLAQFMIIWFIEILIFASVTLLVFGSLPKFDNFFDVLIFYFEAALGSWTIEPYCDAKLFAGQPDPKLCEYGTWFMVLFLLINLVLFLNLVIALLSAVYAYYQDKKLGLYYEIIVGMFPSM
jgi:hypothetical protein